MNDERTIRKSKRLAAKKRRSRPRDDRMSVGEAMGVTPRRGKATNLSEARALQNGRAAAAERDEHRLAGRKGKSRGAKTRRSRSGSLPPRAKPARSVKPYKRSNKAKSVSGTPRRASQVRNSLEARKLTEDVFADDTDDDNADMPPLDGSTDATSEGYESYEGKYDDRHSGDTRLSLIVTPMSQRARRQPADDEFIAPERTPTVYGSDSDGDFVPSLGTTDEEELEELRRGARKRRVRGEDPELNPERGDARGRPASDPGAVQGCFGFTSELPSAFAHNKSVVFVTRYML